MIHPDRRTHPGRVRLLAIVALVSLLAVAGCGASTHQPTGTKAQGASPTSPTAGGSGALAFARCMRANGVPDFPDPSPGGGLLFKLPPGLNPAAPAVRAAQAKCRKVLPNGGPPAPGAQTHPSVQTVTKLLRIARCMRQHGVPQFPDPQTSVPSNPAGIREITDFDGAILLFPAAIDMQAPAYKRALTACGAPPLGLPH